jgi:hypothetical protein
MGQACARERDGKMLTNRNAATGKKWKRIKDIIVDYNA